jgi:hypothetical protein
LVFSARDDVHVGAQRFAQSVARGKSGGESEEEDERAILHCL